MLERTLYTPMSNLKNVHHRPCPLAILALLAYFKFNNHLFVFLMTKNGPLQAEISKYIVSMCF